jgi:outer membrane protein assembly factor BamB
MPLHLASALLLAAFLTPAAHAQSAGEVLWTVDLQGYGTMSQPRVAPDGTIYVVTDRLYAISPAGEILWTAPAFESYVDLGPDGTIYTAARNTIFAYDPDGTERWSFTEDPDNQGWGITTGPTVGPDGNVYAVFIQGGLGAFSLTPEGALRWNVPGFFTEDGAELDRVAFGPENMYYADTFLQGLGCTAPFTGLVSITLDGELEWCISVSGIYDPPVGVQATLDGRAVVIQNALPDAFIRAYDPDGALDWAQTFIPSNIGVGPDNNLYAFINLSTLVSMTADGAVRWAEPQPLNNFPWRATVAPDLSAVVSGSVYGFGVNGIIIAADPTDGSTLWSLPVTGPSAGAGGPAAFSPDGAVVYVPVSTIGLDVPEQLWAVRVHDASSQPVSVSAVPVGGPIVIGPGGGSFQFTVTLTNLTGEPQTFQAWSAVTGPVDREPVVGPLSVTLPAGVTITRTLTQQVPGAAPAGTYTYAVNVGTFGGAVLASDAFPLVKQPGASAREGVAAAAAGWQASGWEDTAATRATSTMPGGFVLSEVYPNPFRGQASLTLEVAASQAVLIELYDGLGRRVATPHDSVLEPGAHTLVLDGSMLPAGVYVVRVTGETFMATRRATLVQ